jgi:energy-coupling factor transporter ATP-binding protein EcfA2
VLERLNDGGKTIIMVTHEDDIAACAKRIIKMRDGVIIDDSPSPRMQKLLNGAVNKTGAVSEADDGELITNWSGHETELTGPSEELTH